MECESSRLLKTEDCICLVRRDRCRRKCLCLEEDWTRQLVSGANRPAPGTPAATRLSHRSGAIPCSDWPTSDDQGDFEWQRVSTLTFGEFGWWQRETKPDGRRRGKCIFGSDLTTPLYCTSALSRCSYRTPKSRYMAAE